MSRLGRGGMASVYRVEDVTTRRELALKQIGGSSRDSIGDKAQLRFRREFHSLAQLDHPRIVEVHDYGHDDSGTFYTMELLDGADLKDHGQVGWREACRILRDIAAALAFLHSRRLIHRDLAPKNVRVTADGRAKLFDFGLLATVGLAGEVAGTPSCIAPESLRGLPLDDRQDLYALGCLGYWMISGRYPYPAKKLSELERLWRKPAAPLRRWKHDVPEPLEALIMGLLCLDPLGRPGSAAEVIDRLQAVAGLEPDPELRTSRGYIASAAMVGRRREMEVMRGCVTEAVDGHGRAVFIEATSGTGKSRLLREVALEAQLAGATAVLAHADSSRKGSYGVVRELVAEAITAAPTVVTKLDRDSSSVLARLFPEVGKKLGPVRPVERVAEPAEERLRIQSALSRWFVELADHLPLAVLVDDMQRCDEASAAVLAALARQAPRRPLFVAVALRSQEETRAPMAVASLRDADVRLGLRGLTEEEVLQLVESLFGSVSHAGRLANWMHGVSGGSPLHCTELARILVDTEAIHFADGIWILPADVASHDVPPELSRAMDARIAQLSAEATEVAEVLAVYGRDFDLRLVRDLATDRAQDVWLHALDELVQQSVLIGDGDRYQFRHDGLREAALRLLDDSRLRALHLRVGTLLDRPNAPDEQWAEIGWHLHAGGEQLRGADFLERAGRRLFEVQALSDSVAPLEAALAIFEARGVPRAKQLELRFMLVAAGWISNREAGLRHMYPAAAAYREYAGITAAETLARYVGRHLGLVFGLAWAFARWIFSRPAHRGPSPMKALSTFAVIAGYAAGLEYANHSLAGLRRIEGLVAPLNVFRGSMAYAAYHGMTVFRDLLMGRLGVARAKLDEVLHIVQTDKFAPLTEFERGFSIAGLRSLIGQTQVTNLDPELQDTLDSMRGAGVKYYQLVADTMQATNLRFRGEEKQAQAIEAEIEATSLQLGSWSTDIQTVLFSHPPYGLCGDIIGLKRMVDALERLVAEGFDYRARLFLTRGDMHRVRGEWAEARACLERALEVLHEDERLTRVWGLVSLAEVELACGNADAAAELAQQSLTWAADEQTAQASVAIRAKRALALADAERGDLYGAEQRLEQAIEQARNLNAAASAGLCHEARARIALKHEDFAAYYLHCAETNRWLRPTGNPALIAVAERLVEAGALAQGEVAEADGDAADTTTSIADGHSEAPTDSQRSDPGRPRTVH